MVIKAIVAKGLSPEIVANPTAFTGFISGVAEHVTVDSSLSDQTIRDLALSLRLTPSDIHLLQAPISGFGTSPGRPVDRHRRRGPARGPRQGDEEGHHGRVPGEVRRPIAPAPRV